MPLWLYSAITVLGAFGLGLLIWSLRGDRARGRRRCPRCWYDMTGAASLTCPECGRTAQSERHLGRTRRRWRWASLGVALVLAAGGAGPGYALATRGWAAVPTPVLIAVVPWVSLSPTFPDGTTNGFATPFARAVQVSLPPWQQRLLAWRLGACLRDSDPKQRQMAAIYIQLIDQGDDVSLDSCIPALVALMDDADAAAAYAGACAVAQLCLTDSAMVPVWERLLVSSPHELVRSTAASMLGRVGSARDAHVMVALLRALLDPGAQVVPQAVYSLGFLKDPAAMPALILAVNSKMPGVCQAACHSIAGLEDAGAPAIPALRRILRDPDNPMAGSAIVALGRIGTPAKEAVPDILERFKLPSARPRGGTNSAVALGRIGDASPEVIAALRSGLEDAAARRNACAQALYRLGWRPSGPDRSLVEQLASGDDATGRLWARMILARTDGTLDDEVDRLIGLLNGQDWWVSEAAIHALDSMGAGARRALPALGSLCPPRGRKQEDSDADLKRQAAEPAIRHITAALEARNR